MARASVPGESHRETGAPNQDAWALEWPEEGGLPLVAAVSDGHGHPDHFRSDRGAAFAAQAAARIVLRFGQERAGAPIESVRAEAAERLPGLVLDAWRERVDADLRAEPTGGEDGSERRLRPYGATLLVAGLFERFAIFMGIGDGEVVLLEGDGRVVRPLPDDPPQGEGATFSLCSPSAEARMRVMAEPLADGGPRLLLLCTDGYSNCFRPREDGPGGEESRRSVSDRNVVALSERVRELGAARVQAELPERLAEASAKGSRDDATLLLVAKVDPGAPDAAPPRGEPADALRTGLDRVLAELEELAVLRRRVARLHTLVTLQTVLIALGIALTTAVWWSLRRTLSAGRASAAEVVAAKVVAAPTREPAPGSGPVAAPVAPPSAPLLREIALKEVRLSLGKPVGGLYAAQVGRSFTIDLAAVCPDVGKGGRGGRAVLGASVEGVASVSSSTQGSILDRRPGRVGRYEGARKVGTMEPAFPVVTLSRKWPFSGRLELRLDVVPKARGPLLIRVYDYVEHEGRSIWVAPEREADQQGLPVRVFRVDAR